MARGQSDEAGPGDRRRRTLALVTLHAHPTDVVLEDVVAGLRESGFVALTGAGVSLESGVVRFRFDASAFLTSARVRREVWESWLDDPLWTAEPNAAHRALTGLQRVGRLRLGGQPVQ